MPSRYDYMHLIARDEYALLKSNASDKNDATDGLIGGNVGRDQMAGGDVNIDVSHGGTVLIRGEDGVKTVHAPLM